MLKQFPGLKDRFPVSQQGNAAKAFADGILVVCNHARRIGRDEGRLAEACSKLTSFQAKKLEDIAGLLKKDEQPAKRFGEDKEEATPVKKKKNEEEKKGVSPGTAALLEEFQIPSTQEESEDEGLLASAKKSNPIPVRKALLKAEVAKKRPAACKKPAAACKKPAAAKAPGTGKLGDEQSVTQPLILMPYKKVGSCAVRIRGGQQILQVKSHKGLEQSKKIAAELKKMLEDGKTLGEVKACKEKKLQK